MIVRRERIQNRTDSLDAIVAGDTLDGASSLVYILGIGFMIYVGLEFVLPALFGATAKTKNAYHKLKSPDGSGSSSSSSSYGGSSMSTRPYSWPSHER